MQSTAVVMPAAPCDNQRAGSGEEKLAATIGQATIGQQVEVHLMYCQKRCSPIAWLSPSAALHGVDSTACWLGMTITN